MFRKIQSWRTMNALRVLKPTAPQVKRVLEVRRADHLNRQKERKEINDANKETNQRKLKSKGKEQTTEWHYRKRPLFKCESCKDDPISLLLLCATT